MHPFLLSNLALASTIHKFNAFLELLVHSPWFWIALLALSLPLLLSSSHNKTSNKDFIKARMLELSNPQDFVARSQIGLHYAGTKQFKKALPFLQEALALQEAVNHIDPRLLEALGHIKLHYGDIKEALTLYQRALQLDEHAGQGDTYLFLAIAHQHNGDHTQAIQFYEKATHTNSSLAEPHYRLAALHHQLGQTDISKRIITSFLKEAQQLPKYIRKRNRRWIWMMHTFPLSTQFYDL